LGVKAIGGKDFIQKLAQSLLLVFDQGHAILMIR
jgi:hypothetical protein